MGLRAMQNDEGRTLLRESRAARVAQAKADDFQRFVKDESLLLGLIS